jgi:hypothetical protein
MAKEIVNPLYDEKCEELLKENDIRFAAIIDENGDLTSGGFKKGVTPLEGDETKLKSFMEFVSKISIRKDFDQSLGPINYLAARRDKAVLVSFPFPVSKIILLISANPSVDIEKLAKKVVNIFTNVM